MEQTLQTTERLNHETTKLSFRFGFLGIGMGGTSIASACADIATNVSNDRYPYSAILINSNVIDLAKVTPRNPNTLKLLIGDGKGAGRDIEMGETLFKSEEEKIENLVKTQFENTDFVWLVVGLGGGTGTGGVIRAIGTLMKNGFKNKFGLILTLPRYKEGRTVINNALQRLQKIYGAMNGLGPVILVDNQKLFDEFSTENPSATVAEYLKHSNTYVAEALHDLNTVTASYLPFGENHFDSSEFGKMLKTPGLIHFARFNAKASSIDAGQVLSYSTKLKQEIENGVLSSGYNLAQAQRAAISVLANKKDSRRLYNFEFQNQLEELVSSIALAASEKPVALYEYETKNRNNNDINVYFYSVFAGLDLPEERIAALMDADREFAEVEKTNEVGQNKNLFAGFQASSNKLKSEEQSFEDLFGEKEENEAQSNDTDALLKDLGLD